ncbi:MAG: isochorismatase family cysteine hydrolase [Nitrososphaerota archaeon]
MKAAVLVIDMLKDFIKAFNENDAKSLIENINKVIDWARKNGLPLIYICDAHEEGDHEFEIWGPHALKGSEGAGIIDELKPIKGDKIVYKNKYSGFFNTRLQRILKRMNIDTLILTGVHTHICVSHTAADAYYRGFKIIVPKQCVSTLNKEDHENGLRIMEKLYAAKIEDIEELIIMKNQKDK